MSNRSEIIEGINDISTDSGFQFELTCSHCGHGYRSEFEPMALSGISDVLETASNIFGGFLGTAADVSNRVKDAKWKGAHDDAYNKAVKTLMDGFRQCPKCQQWACIDRCWNDKKGLCKSCAPDLGVEMAKAQSDKSVEEVYANACMAEEDKHLDAETWRKGIKASCPKCNASLATDSKFCPECGAKINDDTTCKKCQAKLAPGAKFCGECGEKV
jgi:ribosomal protein L40E